MKKILMNDRIRELVRESNLDVYGLGKERYRWEYTVEKFTALIVKECADMVASSSLPDAYSEPCLQEIADEMKEHFGVEQ